MPFFLIGVKINRIKFDHDWVVSLFFLAIGFLFALLQIYEVNFLARFGDDSGSIFVTTILSSVFIVLGIKNLHINIKSSTFNKIFGNNISFNIYVYHVIIATCLQEFFEVNGVIVFVFTFALCLIATHFWRLFKKLLLKFTI